MSLGTNYRVSTVWRSTASISDYEQQATEDCLMCCPTNKVIKSGTKRFLALGGLHEDKLCDIVQQWHRTMSKRFSKHLYSISRATPIDSRIVVAYPRPAFSATKRTNHVFGVLGPRCWTGSALLDCHVLKGFCIYMIGILGG